MEFLSSSDNQKTIKTLNKGIDKTWDLFLYGDKKSGTKPGNIQVYGALVGQREVLDNRNKVQKKLIEAEEDEANQRQ